MPLGMMRVMIVVAYVEKKINFRWAKLRAGKQTFAAVFVYTGTYVNSRRGKQARKREED